MYERRKEMNRRFGKVTAGTVAILLACWITHAVSAEDEPASAQAAKRRRIIVNDDGEVAPPGENRTLDEFLGERIRHCSGTQVDTYVVCVGSTDRGPAGGAKPRLQDTQNRWFPDMKAPPDIDAMTRAYLETAREAGMEIFASIRMNDIHDSWTAKLTYPLKMQRPDLLLGKRGSYPEDAVMRFFWSGFDYAKDEVREHFLEFIESYCRQYDYDGLELDYFRHPLFFKLGQEERNLETMTGFVRQVRQSLNKIGNERGRPYLLAARVPDNLRMSRLTGLDVEQWLQEGLLDLLGVGGGYMPYSGRLKELVDLAHGHGIPAYPCINHFREPTMMRSVASNFWGLGGDGVYLFNYFGVEPGSEKAACLRQLGDPNLLLGHDKHYLPDNGCSIAYCGFSNAPGQFPVRLIDGRPIELIVGDDLRMAAGKGEVGRDRRNVKLRVVVQNVGESDTIALRINDGIVLADDVQRTGPDRFEIEVAAPPLKRGINEIVVLPGLDSVGRLSSSVTGLELLVNYE